VAAGSTYQKYQNDLKALEVKFELEPVRDRLVICIVVISRRWIGDLRDKWHQSKEQNFS